MKIKFKIMFSVIFMIYFAACDNPIENVEPVKQNIVIHNNLSKNTKFNFSKIDIYRKMYNMEFVEKIAFALAKSLDKFTIRKALKKFQSETNNSEKILEATTLFHEKIIDNEREITLLDIMKKYLDTGTYRKINKMDFGLFDIYFPFPIHRNNWNPNKQDLYVAAVNSCLAKGSAPITAFTITGKNVLLNPKAEPKIPTLIVCPSEKYGFYEPYKPPPGWTPKDDHYKVNLTMVYVEHQYDGGFCGDEMEIRVKSKIFYDSQSSWSSLFTIGTYNVLPYNAVTFDDNFIDLNFDDFHFLLNVWEIDDWMCGADDEVATTPWDDLLDYNQYTPHWSTIAHDIEKIDYLTPRIQRVQNDVESSGNNVQLEFKMKYFYY